MTNTTNESEAMEVWQAARRAFNIVPNPYPNAGTEAAARVIATALEARDARIAFLTEWMESHTTKIDALLTRIAELEGALGNAKAQLEYLDERFPTGSTPGVVGQIEAILTKGKTHD